MISQILFMRYSLIYYGRPPMVGRLYFRIAFAKTSKLTGDRYENLSSTATKRRN
jgi:hypothetical protein